MGSSERTKGRCGEQEVARLLRPVFPNVERAWEAAAGKGYDLENTGDYRFQVKRYAKNYESIRTLDTVPGPIPVLVQRIDGKDWLVTITMNHFLKLIALEAQAQDAISRATQAQTQPGQVPEQNGRTGAA
jgi:hypothetical protein